MAFPHKLYAVVSHTSEPVTHKKTLIERRQDKLRELEAKKTIDRANAVLDRLEQRVANYDAQIQGILEQYLKPLQQRRACAQRRIARFEDQILGELSRANLDRVEGFSREFQAVSCPQAVQVDNLALIPNEYIRNKPEADNVVIIRALERDCELMIPGAHLSQTLRTLRK